MKRIILLSIYFLILTFPFSVYAEGSFSCSFTVSLPEGCIEVGGVTVCGPYRVNDIEIIEESTADILGSCTFGGSNTATTGLIPPGYQFWAGRDGGNITVSSNQANLPWIRAHIVRASDNLSVSWEYCNPKGGLNGPGGAVYPDPYQNKEFEFAGYKKLTFTTTANEDYNWMRQNALQPLQEAGYTANLHSFTSTSPGFTAEIGVYDTLDGRVLMEENVITKKGWKVKSGDGTRGNRGTYDYSQKYKGTAKATLYWLAPFQSYKHWEISAEVTFEKDPNSSTEEVDVYYTTSEGKITQKMYTGTPICPGPTFTDTYPIFPGDGVLYIRRGTQPIQYQADASISSLTPIKDHSYSVCCPPGSTSCTSDTLTRNEQEHQWLETGDSDQTAKADGTLQGKYESDNNTGSFEWDLKLVDKPPAGTSPAVQLLLD